MMDEEMEFVLTSPFIIHTSDLIPPLSQHIFPAQEFTRNKKYQHKILDNFFFFFYVNKLANKQMEYPSLWVFRCTRSRINIGFSLWDHIPETETKIEKKILN